MAPSEQEAIDQDVEQGENEDAEREEHKRRKQRIKRRRIGFDAEIDESERRELRKSYRALYDQIQLGGTSTDKAAGDNSDDDDDDSTNSDRSKEKGTKPPDAASLLSSLEELRLKNNKLFQKVAFTREAVLDGDNMDQIAKKFASKVEHLVQVPRYDPLRLINKLKQKCTAVSGSTAGGSRRTQSQSSYASRYFDWKTLGIETGICFNAIPNRVSFLAGPLENGTDGQKKERKPVRRQRRKIEDGEEEKPEEIKEMKKDADQLSAVEKAMKDMKNQLKRRCKKTLDSNTEILEKYFESHEGDIDEETKQQTMLEFQKYSNDIDAVKFLFNPKSFTQTVENIFQFSFLIKKGEGRITVRNNKLKEKRNNHNDDDELKDLSYRNQSGLYLSHAFRSENAPPSRQAVIPFTMNDWRRLCQAYDVKKGDLPHRTGSKQTNRASLSQQSIHSNDS